MVMRCLIALAIAAALLGGPLLPASADEALSGDALIENCTMQPETR